MPEESTVTNIVKTASDGTVKIAVEKYNELLEKAAQPKVINTTVNKIIKTDKQHIEDHQAWGISFLMLGVGCLVTGAVRLRLGRTAAL